MRVLSISMCVLLGCGGSDGPGGDSDTGSDSPVSLEVSFDGGDDSTIDSAADSGADVPVDTTKAETAGDAPGSGVKCASVTCTSAQECCITGGVGSCITKGGACPGGRYGCTSVDECTSGQVCCAGGAGAGGASCTLPGDCPTSHTCKTSADCSGKLKNCVDLGYIKICST